jgi:cholinesterase
LARDPTDTCADPAKYDGTQSYTTPLGRGFLIVQELVFACNTYYLNTAFDNQTYAYEFQIAPGFHAYDVPYTFDNGSPTNVSAGFYAPVAAELQGYLTNFAMTGNPNGPGLTYFPRWGTNGTVNGLNWNATTQQKDDTDNVRCAWWQKGLFA